MADTKISALTAVTTPAATDEFAVNQGGASKKVALSQIWTPGTAGSPDLLPASPGDDDDEFETLTGWTTLGTLDTLNVTDAPSHLHIRKNTSGNRYDGVYKTAPDVPYTVTAKLSDFLHEQNYQGVGLIILDTTPTNLYWFGPVTNGVGATTWDYIRMQATVGGTRGSFTDTTVSRCYPYIRMIVTSGTDVTCQVSAGGLVWYTVYASSASGLTPTKVGFALWAYSAVPAEAAIDWIRFT